MTMQSGSDAPIHAPAGGSRARTRRLDAVRGFVFLSGQKWMAEHGLLERHQALMPDEVRARTATATATDWIRLDDALSIYRACDALGLPVDQQIELGEAVSRANNGIVIRTLANLAGRIGLSPWVALRSIDKVWQRNNRGGGIAVFKLGERSARLEFWQVPLAQSPFFVTSMRGAIAAGLEMFAERLLVTELPDHLSPDGFALRISW
jgi:hypothetical protein